MIEPRNLFIHNYGRLYGYFLSFVLGAIYPTYAGAWKVQEGSSIIPKNSLNISRLRVRIIILLRMLMKRLDIGLEDALKIWYSD